MERRRSRPFPQQCDRPAPAPVGGAHRRDPGQPADSVPRPGRLAARPHGIPRSEVDVVEAFAAWSLVRALGSIPITPGGLGVRRSPSAEPWWAFGAHNAARGRWRRCLYRSLTFLPSCRTSDLAAAAHLQPQQAERGARRRLARESCETGRLVAENPAGDLLENRRTRWSSRLLRIAPPCERTDRRRGGESPAREPGGRRAAARLTSIRPGSDQPRTSSGDLSGRDRVGLPRSRNRHRRVVR